MTPNLLIKRNVEFKNCIYETLFLLCIDYLLNKYILLIDKFELNVWGFFCKLNEFVIRQDK